MSNVVQFSRKRDITQDTPTSQYSFEKQVVSDINKLSQNTGVPFNEALLIAKNFYKKYPMLMEFVRSPEVLLDKSEDSSRLLSCLEDIRLMDSIDVLNSIPIMPIHDEEDVCTYCGNKAMVDAEGICEECFLKSVVTLDSDV